MGTAFEIVCFISHTVSSAVVAFIIYFLIKSICITDKSSDSAPSAEDPSQAPATDDIRPGDKIIFWSSCIGIILFFIRSITFWFCFLVILMSGNDIEESDVQIYLDVCFAGYVLALWTMSLTFVLRIDYSFKNTFLG